MKHLNRASRLLDLSGFVGLILATDAMARVLGAPWHPGAVEPGRFVEFGILLSFTVAAFGLARVVQIFGIIATTPELRHQRRAATASSNMEVLYPQGQPATPTGEMVASGDFQQVA